MSRATESLPLGLRSVSVNPSSPSASRSPRTATVISSLETVRGAYQTVPEGSMPSTKSSAVAGLAPEPVTTHSAPKPLELPPGWKLARKV